MTADWPHDLQASVSWRDLEVPRLTSLVRCLGLEHSSSYPVHQTLPAPHLYTPTSTHLLHSGGSVWVLSTHHHTQYIRRYLLHTCTHPRQHTRFNSGGISRVTRKLSITSSQCLLFVLSVGYFVLVLTIGSLLLDISLAALNLVWSCFLDPGALFPWSWSWLLVHWLFLVLALSIGSLLLPWVLAQWSWVWVLPPCSWSWLLGPFSLP